MGVLPAAGLGSGSSAGAAAEAGSLSAPAQLPWAALQNGARGLAALRTGDLPTQPPWLGPNPSSARLSPPWVHFASVTQGPHS